MAMVGAVANVRSPVHASPVWVTVAAVGNVTRSPGTYVTEIPAMERGAADENGTSTLTSVAVADVMTPCAPPPNVTETLAGLNWRSAVAVIVSSEPPGGVVLESAPVKAVGSTMTSTVSVTPPPETSTQVAAGPTAVTTARSDVFSGTGAYAGSSAAVTFASQPANVIGVAMGMLRPSTTVAVTVATSPCSSVRLATSVMIAAAAPSRSPRGSLMQAPAVSDRAPRTPRIPMRRRCMCDPSSFWMTDDLEPFDFLQRLGPEQFPPVRPA